MRLPASAAVLLLAAATLLSAPPLSVPEAEPNGFTTPAPQPLGLLSPDGIDVAGALDPTSPSGLDPGDRDGYSFTMAAAGPLSATVDDGLGTIFVLALAREQGGVPVPLGAVLGRAPLTLSVPDLAMAATYRVGVAALGDGSVLPYTLSLRTVDSLPPWNGEICAVETVGAEPDGSAAEATDLGFFTGVLCGRGTLETVFPPGSGETGDADTFRFRNVLPVAARLLFRADPGLLRIEAQQLVFVGAQPFAAAAFGEEGSLDLPVLQPGADYLVRISADQGEAPLAYSFSLAPVAAPPPPAPEPLEVRRARVRLEPAGPRTSFSLRGEFAPGLGAALGPGTPFAWSLRGAGGEFGEGVLTTDRKGRLLHRAPKGTAGLRRLLFDPFLGRLVLKGRGVPFTGDPSDPQVEVLVTIGDLELGAAFEGKFRSAGRILTLKR